MFSTLLMGGGGHTREKDHQNVKSLIIFAHDCRSRDRFCTLGYGIDSASCVVLFIFILNIFKVFFRLVLTIDLFNYLGLGLGL